MPNQLVQRLKTFNQYQLEEIYRNCFNTDAGQLVLEDLKGRFWFYAPAPNIREIGNEDVIKHINNMLNPLTEEAPDGQLSIGE